MGLSKNLDEYVELAFKSALFDLIENINTAHKSYLTHKKSVIERIQDSSIFIGTSYDLRGKSLREISITKKIALRDFYKRCKIREDLAAAGNECTKKSRYFDPFDPRKNADVSQLPENLRVLLPEMI